MILILSTLFALCSASFSTGPQIRRRRKLNQPLRCGCLDCDDDVWSRPAKDLVTGEEHTCGDRITYLMTNLSYSEEDACSTIAGEDFPTICGRSCNPSRCDGRFSPPPASFPSFELQDVATVKEDTSLYCYPSFDKRTQWTNVFGKYIMQAKEDVVPCGPGNNHYSSSTVSLRNDKIKLQFRKENGKWTGSEIRLILPADEPPFSYGRYSFSVERVTVRNSSTGALVSTQLPPSLVLGMFTWDSTDDYATHENYNHEVDIEISQWNIKGNADAQFLVQPAKTPQFERFFSGGADGSLDQGGHVWRFDWHPNRVDWHTTAAGGRSFSYSTADAIYYGTPDRVQCLPANVEIRINVWNLLGEATPTNMTDDEVVEVTIDNFVYKPSGQQSAGEGEPCTKWCQCGYGNACIDGVCSQPEMQSDQDAPEYATPPPTPSQQQHGNLTQDFENPDDQERPNQAQQQQAPEGALCAAHPACSHLAGDCCPTADGLLLGCCNNPGEQLLTATTSNSNLTTSNATGGMTSDDNPLDAALCSAHEACQLLEGACCPTRDGVVLDCCNL